MPFAREKGARNPDTLKENISGLERLLDHAPEARIVWAHAGWDHTGERTVALMRRLLAAHPNLYMSIKLDPQGPQRTSPWAADASIRPGWLAMLREYPDRFVIGSDQFFDEGESRLDTVRRFIDALPADLARRIGHDNAVRLYHLDSRTAAERR